MTDSTDSNTLDSIEQDTRAWLERAVIGLNLCPFAKSVHVKRQIHFAMSHAATPQELLDDLKRELQDLIGSDASMRSTTLLIVPHCLTDFLDFNDFLAEADSLLRKLKLDSDLQIASFHPDYQFAGTNPDDIENCTNRSPYPMLHLLRQSSVERAVSSMPDTNRIFEKNIETMERLGWEGWRRVLGKR